MRSPFTSFRHFVRPLLFSVSFLLIRFFERFPPLRCGKWYYYENEAHHPLAPDCTFLSSCNKATPEVLVPEITEEPTAPPEVLEPEPIPTETPRVYQLPEPLPNRTRYKLDFIFDYYSHYGSVSQQIVYTNKSSQPLDEIMLVVPPRNYEGSYDQDRITGDLVASFREEGIFTHIALSRTLEPSETTIINIAFRIYLPTSRNLRLHRPTSQYFRLGTPSFPL